MSEIQRDPERASLPAPPQAIAAVIIFSSNVDALARFYREYLGVPLIRVQVPELAPHWACDIQHVYFSIWPEEGPPPKDRPSQRSGVAFYVRNVQREYNRLVDQDVEVVFAPRRTALGLLARLKDPEGNIFELYQPLR